MRCSACRHDWLGEILPCVSWIKTYNLRAWLLVSGVEGGAGSEVKRNLLALHGPAMPQPGS